MVARTHLRDTVEEADDARSAARDAKLAVRRMYAPVTTLGKREPRMARSASYNHGLCSHEPQPMKRTLNLKGQQTRCKCTAQQGRNKCREIGAMCYRIEIWCTLVA
eukprot:6195371-Pleurochrysis_carterae.AAC.1